MLNIFGMSVDASSYLFVCLIIHSGLAIYESYEYYVWVVVQ